MIGRADYLSIDPKNGAIIAYLNTGKGIAQSWAQINHGKSIAAGVGVTGDGVFFADLNGDRRADYISVKNGKVVWWRNDGPSAIAKVGWKWHGPVVLHIGAAHVTPKNVLFGDINGDGTYFEYFLIVNKGLRGWWTAISTSIMAFSKIVEHSSKEVVQITK